MGLQHQFQCEAPLGAPLWGSSARRKRGAILRGCRARFEEILLLAFLSTMSLLWALLLNVSFPQYASQGTTAQRPGAPGGPSPCASVPHPLPRCSAMQAACELWGAMRSCGSAIHSNADSYGRLYGRLDCSFCCGLYCPSAPNAPVLHSTECEAWESGGELWTLR